MASWARASPAVQAGLPGQLPGNYPANYAAYHAACASGEVKLGQMFVFDSARLGPRRYVINFPTKAHWRAKSQLTQIQAGLKDLAHVVRKHGIRSVAVPALGCGNGGLDWGQIQPLIEQTFADLADVRVLLYPPEGAPDPVR